MMNKVIMLIFVAALLSCANSSPSVTKTNPSIDSIDISKSIELKNKSTTLDSLQGSWISVLDKKSKIEFIKDVWYDYYDGEKLANSRKIFLVNECIKEGKVSNSSDNGTILVVQEEEENSCYVIDFLSNKRLAFVYEGRDLAFIKEVK
jgi:hypothetical protein